MKNNQYSNTSILKPLAIIVMAMFLLLNGAGGHAFASVALHQVNTVQTIASEPDSKIGRIIVKTSGHNKGLVPAEVHLLYFQLDDKSGHWAETGFKCTSSEPGVFIFDHVSYSNHRNFQVQVVKKVDWKFDGVLADSIVASVYGNLAASEVTVNVPMDYELLVGTINVTYDKSISHNPPVVVNFISNRGTVPPTTSDDKNVIHFNYRSDGTVLSLYNATCPALDKQGWRKSNIANTPIDLTKSYTLHVVWAGYSPDFRLNLPGYGFTLNVAK